jgi:hypothetical protein
MLSGFGCGKSRTAMNGVAEGALRPSAVAFDFFLELQKMQIPRLRSE